MPLAGGGGIFLRLQEFTWEGSGVWEDFAVNTVYIAVEPDVLVLATLRSANILKCNILCTFLPAR